MAARRLSEAYYPCKMRECMQKLQVYSANSLSDVIERLASFCSSGQLTIWRATDTHHEEASLLVEAGQMLRLRWGSYEGEVNESLLHQLTLWGAIYFVFRVRESVPLLPAPAHPSYEEQPRSAVPVTQPLQTPASSLRRTRPGRAKPPPAAPGTPLPQVGDEQPPHVAARIQPVGVSEFTVPTLTETARSYPVMTVPRYDRAILLLIDGRRTIADISRLTRRTFSAVCASLTRLRKQQLVDGPR